MGMLGRRLAGPDAPALARELARALAGEWFGHYNYWLAAQSVRGHWSPDVAALLRARSARALERADRITARLRELGGEPPPKLEGLTKKADDKPFRLPRSLDDARGVLKAVLDAERTSARSFERLFRKAGEADPLTRRLAESLLADAVASESELERLLGEEAPEFDGS